MFRLSENKLIFLLTGFNAACILFTEVAINQSKNQGYEKHANYAGCTVMYLCKRTNKRTA